MQLLFKGIKLSKRNNINKGDSSIQIKLNLENIYDFNKHDK